jgi:hypothetical protein
MSFGFNYPVPGYTGAVSAGNLVTACGTYDPPPSGTHGVMGLVYPAGADKHPSPPSGASGASTGYCDGYGNWYFSGTCPPLWGGGYLQIGTSYTLRVWETHYILGGTPAYDCNFTACQSGYGGCVPNCPQPGPQPAPQPPPDQDLEPVIVGSASRFFRVYPAREVFDLWSVFDYPQIRGQRQFILLTYDEAASNFERAIWLSPVQQGTRLRLEVKRGPCCHQALMVRVRVGGLLIESLERWESSCFEIVRGGTFLALTPEGFPREGAVTLKPGRSDDDAAELGQAPPLPDSLTRAPELPAPELPAPELPEPQQQSGAPRARRRGRGRG